MSRDIEHHVGDPGELAEQHIDSDLTSLVERLRPSTLTGSRFDVRAVVRQGTALLAAVEVSPQRLAGLILQDTCTAIAELQLSTGRLAREALQAGVNTWEITTGLKQCMGTERAESLVTASHTANDVSALIAGRLPSRLAIDVIPCEDGVARIIVEMWPDRLHWEDGEEINDTLPIWDDLVEEARQEAAGLLALLNTRYSVTAPDGRPATPIDLVPTGRSTGSATIHAQDGT
ncbi:hypothetical protein [Kitasatospora arboriphila]